MQIPMFLVFKKDFKPDGTRPCILYGYGGFNISVKPSLSITRLLFISLFGGCFAVANVRGGGEYGEDWHRNGSLENKQNSFDDFQVS